jgi:predicted phage terminase large subunit-like protein
MTAIEREMELYLASQSYIDYVQLIHAGAWKRASHLDLVCKELESIMRGENKRLMVFMPPRHGKSMCVTETFPSYYLGHNPHKRVMELSYGAELAQEFGKKNRDKVLEYGYDIFRIRLSNQQATKTNWKIAGTDGGMYSVGFFGSVTGRGADLLIVDDPIRNRAEAESSTYREKIWAEYQSTVATRLHSGGAIIIILTRWHEDDLAARLLKPEYGKAEDWKVLSLPAVCEDGSDLLGRKIGQALWPMGGYDETWAARQKETVGAYAWNALYQQHPTPSTGGIFKREWWQRWRELPGDLFDFIQSWDCTFKDANTSDYVVGQVWARSKKNPANRYLLDQVRARMTFTETVQAVRSLSAKWRQTTRKLVEDAANGTAVMDVLKKEMPGLIPVQPMGGKVVRAHAVTAVVEAGNVFIPDASVAPWTHDFIEELSSFPNGAHDDQVDAMTQANAYYNDKGKFDPRSLI